MYIHDGHHMSDAWYYVDDVSDVVHMYYLTSRMDNDDPPFVGHAISSDLVNWQRLTPALRTGSPGSWDDLRLFTGSVIKRDGRYWLAHSATDTVNSSMEERYRFQRGGMAVSDDLLTWHKLPENPLTQADPAHYEQMSTGQRKMVHWRDPFLYDDGDVVYQFISARRYDGKISTRGTVALAKSSNMVNWEILPPIHHDQISEEMEVPQVYQINGRWYLVFCTLGRFLAPEFAIRFGKHLPERSNFSMIGESPFGPFRIHGTGQIVQHPPDAYFYAAQLVQFRGQWFLLATERDESSERISDPLPVRAEETGVHA